MMGLGPMGLGIRKRSSLYEMGRSLEILQELGFATEEYLAALITYSGCHSCFEQ